MRIRQVIAAAVVAGVASLGAARAQGGLGTKPQEVLLTKIAVNDIAKSYEFYTKVIGLQRAGAGNRPAPTAADNAKDFVEVPMNFSGSMADSYIVLSKRRGEAPAREFTKLVYVGFKVPSVAEAVARTFAAGYKPTREALTSGALAFGFIEDPDGYTIEFLQAPSYSAK